MEKDDVTLKDCLSSISRKSKIILPTRKQIASNPLTPVHEHWHYCLILESERHTIVQRVYQHSLTQLISLDAGRPGARPPEEGDRRLRS